MSNRLRCNNAMATTAAAAALHFYGARSSQQQQQQPATAFTSTAKLPIETVKQLIGAVSRRPSLWIRHHSGQKRFDINQLWQEVSQETQLPADVCRVKWGHLRDNFRKVFIRNTLSDETPTTWRFYNDMRFMEKSVAENIMRQNRYKDQTRYWPDLQHNPQHLLNPMIPICTLKEVTKRDSESMQISDAYSLNDVGENNKRIKLEVQDGYEINKQQQRSKMNNYKQTEEREAEHEPDDDDYDEDTATEENDNEHSNLKQIVKDASSSLPIEVFDDDDDDDDDDGGGVVRNTNNSRPLFNGISESASPIDEHSNHLSSSALKKTETEEQDSDRMFLLSLLPYLRNVDVNRKLRVRQKLQNVLIDELP